MAAYAATVTLDDPMPDLLSAKGLRIIRGVVNVTNYNTSLAEITGITGKFRSGAPTVVLGGVTSNGLVAAWVPASKSIKAWFPTQQTAGTGNRAGVEATTDTNVGSVPFVAFGV